MIFPRTVMILEIGKHGSIGPLTFRNRGPLAHLGDHPPNNNAVPKYEKIGEHWSKKTILCMNNLDLMVLVTNGYKVRLATSIIIH